MDWGTRSHHVLDPLTHQSATSVHAFATYLTGLTPIPRPTSSDDASCNLDHWPNRQQIPSVGRKGPSHRPTRESACLTNGQLNR
jgi:hypothetical protein